MSANPVARPSSRRSFLTAALAGTAAGATTIIGYAAIAASAEADPVIALVAKAEDARRAHDDALDATFEASSRYRQNGGDPELPEALLHRGEADIVMSIFGSRPVSQNPTDERYTFTPDAIAHFRRHARHRYEVVPHPTMPPPNVLQKALPWPEAQARVDEILAAWDAHEAEIVRRKEVAGISATAADHERATREYRIASLAVIRTFATTRAGIEAKADFILGSFGNIDEMSDHVDDDDGRNPRDEAFALSVVRDLLTLRGQA